LSVMVLPLSLLRAAQGHAILVELKSGDTYNGHLVNSDSWMNINLKDVVCTSRDGQKFWRINECYIRGCTIKYLSIANDVLESVKDEDNDLKASRMKPMRGRGRGRGRLFNQARGGRGRGTEPNAT